MKHASAGARGGERVIASKLRSCTHKNAHLTSSAPPNCLHKPASGGHPFPCQTSLEAHTGQPAPGVCVTCFQVLRGRRQARAPKHASTNESTNACTQARTHRHTHTHTSTHTHIHKQGKSRSAAVAAAYLIRTHGLTVAQGPFLLVFLLL
jgi:hypothetical protein